MDPTQPLPEVPSPLSPPRQVPATVSHSEFWHRYFYKVHQLEQVCWPNQEVLTQPWVGGWVLLRKKGDRRGYQEFWSQNQSLGKGVPGLLLARYSSHFQEQARRDALKQRAEQSISEEPGWEEEEGKRY